ncbi:MAG: RadC family protein, partial [Chthoniobacterales bacterium]
MAHLLSETPKQDLPREKLARLGAAALSDAELLAIFIRTGVRGRNALQVAGDLLRERGGILELARSTREEIIKAGAGIGPAKATELLAAFEIGRRLARGVEDKPVLNSPAVIYEVLGVEFQNLPHEVLRVVLVDARLRLIRMETISSGSLTETVAHPREILRPALLRSAYGIILIHNHPSGDPNPSSADIRLTKNISEAAELLQIQFVDHLIFGISRGGALPYCSL